MEALWAGVEQDLECQDGSGLKTWDKSVIAGFLGSLLGVELLLSWPGLLQNAGFTKVLDKVTHYVYVHHQSDSNIPTFLIDISHNSWLTKFPSLYPKECTKSVYNTVHILVCS